MGHRPQRGVSRLEAPPKDNPVVQAVGLALPEFHHLWGQDVATPTKRSRGLGAPCVFPTMSLPTAPQNPVKDVARLYLRVDREEKICNSRERGASSKHEGPGVPFSVTMRPRSPVFWLRHLLFLVQLLQFLVFLSQILFRGRRQRKGQTRSMIHGMTTYCACARCWGHR